MSMLSVFWHKAADFLTAAANAAPADQHTTLSNAASAATTAAQAVEGALPVLAKVVADAALAQVPGMGAYVPALNEFLDILAAEILSRKTAAKPAS
jgi:hypothetical protein